MCHGLARHFRIVLFVYDRGTRVPGSAKKERPEYDISAIYRPTTLTRQRPRSAVLVRLESRGPALLCVVNPEKYTYVHVKTVEFARAIITFLKRSTFIGHPVRQRRCSITTRIGFFFYIIFRTRYPNKRYAILRFIVYVCRLLLSFEDFERSRECNDDAFFSFFFSVQSPPYCRSSFSQMETAKKSTKTRLRKQISCFVRP